MILLKNLRLEIKDFNSLPPQNTLARKLLSDSVSNALNNGNTNQERDINTEQYDLHIRSNEQTMANLFDSEVHLGTTPWFDAWRDCFLRIAFTGDHEFLKNYLACKLTDKVHY